MSSKNKHSIHNFISRKKLTKIMLSVLPDILSNLTRQIHPSLFAESGRLKHSRKIRRVYGSTGPQHTLHLGVCRCCLCEYTIGAVSAESKHTTILHIYTKVSIIIT